jgi:hypothetical protein
MNGEAFKHDPDEEEWVDPYPKKKRHWKSWIVVPLLLLALYVLSTGPAFRMAKSGLLSERNLKSVYMPLIALSEASPTVETVLGWYIFDVWKCPHPIIRGH